MKWFRANIKHGTRLALTALAIQFVLSFGHFHAVAAPAPAVHAGPVTSDAGFAGDVADQSALPQKPTSDHDRQSSDGCAICAVIGMANAVLFSTPPLLVLPQAVEFLYRTTDAAFVHLNSARIAFQPRAPPIS